jgi:hypothetical protein
VTHRRATAASCRLGPRTAARAIMGWTVVAAAAFAAGSDVRVRVESGVGPPREGVLRSIDRDAIDLLVDGEPQRLPLADVRTLTAISAADGEPGAPPAVEVVGDGGLTLGGDDLRWEDGQAMIIRGDATIEVPIERVRRAAWRPIAGGAASVSDWLAAVPAEPTADLVAVMQPEGFELVECAITAISPAAVTVMLDGERIPVHRGKVLGLVWVRPPAKAAVASGATQVLVEGGTLGAATVEWRDGGLVLDGAIRVPGEMLRSIDFAAGRTVALVAVEPEASSSEPFFAGLTAIDGLGAFFAPRIVTPEDAPPAWLMRPRSTATWRVPEGSRRFRARAVRMAAASAAAVVVTARADDGPEWRQRVAGDAAVPIEIAVADARRLTIGVEFADGGVGVPVRFDDAGFEK